ncbi:hypothetical protein [Stutzerimonas balearica]|uniref:hypothetical protein n=1 Tax=Stutzerimonas balearica TaxID=74829 RepID=UPI003787051E
MSGKARKTDVGRRVEPEPPDFYMPAMPPLGLQRSLCEWLRAWRQRRCIGNCSSSMTGLWRRVI